jgi:hypothetical protein
MEAAGFNYASDEDFGNWIYSKLYDIEKERRNNINLMS